MKISTLNNLSLDGLTELLVQGTKELLEALDRRVPDEIEIRIKKKQVQAIHDAIMYKKKGMVGVQLGKNG